MPHRTGLETAVATLAREGVSAARLNAEVKMKLIRPVEPTLGAADFSRSATPADRPTMADVRHEDAFAYLCCPIASRFIDTLDEARAYYDERLVGDHIISVNGTRVIIRFNAEEIHLFTDHGAPRSMADLVARPSDPREVRSFSRERARRMDAILPTLSAPGAAIPGKGSRSILVHGPGAPSAWRLGVVVAPDRRDRRVYFVRSAFEVAPKNYAAALRGARVAWPPK
jgi:hypothetical protein